MTKLSDACGTMTCVASSRVGETTSAFRPDNDDDDDEEEEEAWEAARWDMIDERTGMIKASVFPEPAC